jgi:PAS domain S-box-containing protein
MKTFSSNNFLKVFFACCILVTFIISGVVYLQIHRLIEENNWVFHTRKTIETAQRIMLNVNTLEKVQRDFILTGNENYIPDYNALIQQVEQNIKKFMDLTADNPLQQSRIQVFSQLFTEYKKILNSSIEVRKKSGMQAAIAAITTDNAKWMSNQLTQNNLQVVDEEKKLLGIRHNSAVIAESRAILLALLFNVAAIGLIILCFYWVNRNINEKTILEERMQVFLNSSKDYGFLILKPAGEIISWNRGAELITGYTENEVIGKHFSLFSPEENIKKKGPQHELEIALEKGFFEGNEWRIRKDGQRFWANIIVSPMYDGYKRLIGFGKIIRDITDKKRTEDTLNENMKEKIKINEQLRKTMNELQRSNEDLGQFAYIASHDLQEPLRVISNYTKLLEKRYKDKLDEDANDFINYIVDGSKRMQLLITDLLAYSRINTRNMPLEQVDPNFLLYEVLANLKMVIDEKNVVIKYDKLPMVWADPSKIRQLFQNLITNAIKFCEQNPVIKITGKKEGKKITFCVEDNGIGIAPEYQERIFEIFKRLHTRDQYPGTGIGLAICKKIVSQYGGEIWVESALNKGSKFYFTYKQQGEGHGKAINEP